jgi:uncharacterized membrane protein YfcA
LEIILLLILPAVFAGLVQGLTGFGSAIILMIFMPSLFPIAQSAGIAACMMAIPNFLIVWRYRKSVTLKKLIFPFIIYGGVAAIAIHLGDAIPGNALKLLLGLLLVALTVYFFLQKKADNRNFPFFVALLFMMISGFFNGLFGIGGPLMALYFLSLAKTKEEYLSNIQLFFLIDMVYVTTLRVHNQILGLADVKFVLLGMIGTLAGSFLAAKLMDKMDIALVKKVIYVFIGLSGLYYIVQAVL